MQKIISVDKREKYYAVLIECEEAGRHEYKVWNNSHPDFIKGLKAGSIIKIISSDWGKYGAVLENYEVIKEGRLGLTKKQITENLNIIYGNLHRLINTREEAESIKNLIRNNEELFIVAPAAKGHHHNYIGGLLQHTVEVLLNTVDYGKNLADLGAILHDFGKIYEYKIDTETGVIENNEEFRQELMLSKDSKIYTHILWAYNWCMERGFKELAHIVGSHHNMPEWGSLFKPMTSEAHMVFIADYKSSHLGAITVDDLITEN